MGFTTSELWRLRQELGYPSVTIGALPWVDTVSIFEQVIAPFTETGSDTTSSTVVVASTAPARVVLTLADATGFSAYDRVFVDVDPAQELATVQSVVGSTISLYLSNGHGAIGSSYPVIVDGGVARARLIFRHLDTIDAQQGKAPQRAGIKKVDEVEFFGDSRSGKSGVMADLNAQREYWRKELADLIGVPYLRGIKRGGAGHSTEVY